MFVNEFQDQELALGERLLRKIQARWRGAVVRDSMRKVRREYAAIFDEIEENPSCIIQWNLADQVVISKPQFISHDRRNCVLPGVAAAEERVNVGLSLPFVPGCSDVDLQPAVSGLNIAKPAVSLQQQSHADNLCGRNDLPHVSVEQQHSELKLDTCSADDRQNCDDVSADCATGDNCDSVTVISGKALPENLQTQSTGLPSVALAGSTIQEQRHNLALELLWVQQAIHSRKQYLRLKSQLADQELSQ